jgi:prevent-host-death family protein
VERLTATDAARRFSEVLDAVERSGETFVVVRHGRAVATIAPANVATGRAVKQLLRNRRVDQAWRRQLAALRAALKIEDRNWTG